MQSHENAHNTGEDTYNLKAVISGSSENTYTDTGEGVCCAEDVCCEKNVCEPYKPCGLTDEEYEFSKFNVTPEQINKDIDRFNSTHDRPEINNANPKIKDANQGIVIYRFMNEVPDEQWEKAKYSIYYDLRMRYKMYNVGATITVNVDSYGKESKPKILGLCFRTCDGNIISIKFTSIRKRSMPSKLNACVTDNELDENGELDYEKLVSKFKKDFFGNKSIFCINDFTQSDQLSENFKTMIVTVYKNIINYQYNPEIDGDKLEFNDGEEHITEEYIPSLTRALVNY